MIHQKLIYGKKNKILLKIGNKEVQIFKKIIKKNLEEKKKNI